MEKMDYDLQPLTTLEKEIMALDDIITHDNELRKQKAAKSLSEAGASTSADVPEKNMFVRKYKSNGPKKQNYRLQKYNNQSKQHQSPQTFAGTGLIIPQTGVETVQGFYRGGQSGQRYPKYRKYVQKAVRNLTSNRGRGGYRKNPYHVGRERFNNAFQQQVHSNEVQHAYAQDYHQRYNNRSRPFGRRPFRGLQRYQQRQQQFAPPSTDVQGQNEEEYSDAEEAEEETDPATNVGNGRNTLSNFTVLIQNPQAANVNTIADDNEFVQPEVLRNQGYYMIDPYISNGQPNLEMPIKENYDLDYQQTPKFYTIGTNVVTQRHSIRARMNAFIQNNIRQLSTDTNRIRRESSNPQIQTVVVPPHGTVMNLNDRFTLNG